MMESGDTGQDLEGGCPPNDNSGDLRPSGTSALAKSQAVPASVPSSSEMELMLAGASDGDSLADLASATAALVDVARRQDVARQQLIEIAEWHMKVKRKLGLLLLQGECRGGDRTKCQAATLPNGGRPGGLNASAAKRCRQLARISEPVFEGYLTRAKSGQSLPSEAGVIRFAKSPVGAQGEVRKPPRRVKSGDGNIEVGEEALDAVQRCLGDIDVCIGKAKVECRRRYSAANWVEAEVSGIALVSVQDGKADWLARAAEWIRAAKCDQVVVLLAEGLDASALSAFSEASWQLCLIAEPCPSGVVAYIGSRREAFFAAMHEHGLVVGVYQ